MIWSRIWPMLNLHIVFLCRYICNSCLHIYINAVPLHQKKIPFVIKFITYYCIEVINTSTVFSITIIMCYYTFSGYTSHFGTSCWVLAQLLNDLGLGSSTFISNAVSSVRAKLNKDITMLYLFISLKYMEHIINQGNKW